MQNKGPIMLLARVWRGFSLIEVLISLLLVNVGLLALLTLQIKVLQDIQQQTDATIATQEAENLAEIL